MNFASSCSFCCLRIIDGKFLWTSYWNWFISLFFGFGTSSLLSSVARHFSDAYGAGFFSSCLVTYLWWSLWMYDFLDPPSLVNSCSILFYNITYFLGWIYPLIVFNWVSFSCRSLTFSDLPCDSSSFLMSLIRRAMSFDLSVLIRQNFLKSTSFELS